MDPLVHASLALRRLARRGYGVLCVFGLGAMVVAGMASQPFGPELAMAAALWAFLLVTRAAARVTQPGEASVLADFEIAGLLAVGLCAALLRHDGALDGRLSPATYVLVGFVAAFARPAAGALAVAYLLVLEALVRAHLLGDRDLDGFATRAAFVVAFAVVNHGFCAPRSPASGSPLPRASKASCRR